MSRISKEAEKVRNAEVHRKGEAVINFMAGESFKINPLDTLKIVSASSIFGEPSYYRGSEVRESKYSVHPLVRDTVVDDRYVGMSTTDLFTKVIDEALDYDFKGTIEWAAELRRNFNMRLNPQVIMVRAAMHKNRKDFTCKYTGMFRDIQMLVMSRADEPASQVAYYIFANGGKKNMPTMLKKTIANKLSSLGRYQIAKYKNSGIGIIDTVRITHAHSKVIDELMKSGTVEIADNENTWENLRSKGIPWNEVCSQIEMGHMALLRNIRNVFDVSNGDYGDEFYKAYLDKLKSGVIGGKQFPFRYMNALNKIKKSDINHKVMVIDALEECMDIACDNMPKLKGKTMCLSDNSGSAWGSFNSDYGRVTVAQIDNLSSVIAARNSEEGYVGKFGDKLKVFPISKRNGVLSQANDVSRKGSGDVGGGTEGGIWKFFKNAIENKEHWDNIFIYSDQQAGHGGLYGTGTDIKEYRKLGFSCKYSYVNVFDLVLEYRKRVNPKVNVFSVQTAGYNNVVVPENAYRTSILYGWTGNELTYAYKINAMWDEIDNRNK